MLEQRGPICAPKQPPGCCLVLSVSCRAKKEQHRGHEEGTTGDVARLARQERLDWGTSNSTSLIDGGKDHKIDGGKDHKNLSNLSNLSNYQTDVGKPLQKDLKCQQVERYPVISERGDEDFYRVLRDCC